MVRTQRFAEGDSGEMNNESKQRYRELIRKGVESTGRQDAESRRAIYDKLRFANETMLAKKGTSYSASQSADIRRALDEAIAEHDNDVSMIAAEAEPDDHMNDSGPEAPIDPRPSMAEFASPATAKEATTMRRPGRRWPLVLPGIAAGVAGVVFLGWLLIAAGALSISFDRTKIAQNALVQRELTAAAPAMQDTVAFLEKIRAAVVKRQKEDAAGLTSLAGSKFIGLAAFDAGLQRELPKRLPRGSGVNLRADGTAYKIIFNYPFCPTAKLLRPDMVDPVRDVKGLGCAGFGVWNEAGAKF